MLVSHAIFFLLSLYLGLFFFEHARCCLMKEFPVLAQGYMRDSPVASHGLLLNSSK